MTQAGTKAHSFQCCILSLSIGGKRDIERRPLCIRSSVDLRGSRRGASDPTDGSERCAIGLWCAEFIITYVLEPPRGQWVFATFYRRDKPVL